MVYVYQKLNAMQELSYLGSSRGDCHDNFMNTTPLPEIGKKYRHYKRGGVYTVIGIARHSETDEALVVYQAEYDHQLWARPAAMFLEEIDGVPRFSEVEE
jgi:hypothetical protein